MKEQLEAFRLEAIRHLETEQQHRNTKLREMQEAIAKLEAENEAAISRTIRASRPLTSASACPKCWIWDGEISELIAIPGGDDHHDLFRCKRCGDEVEAPI